MRQRKWLADPRYNWVAAQFGDCGIAAAKAVYRQLRRCKAPDYVFENDFDDLVLQTLEEYQRMQDADLLGENGSHIFWCVATGIVCKHIDRIKRRQRAETAYASLPENSPPTAFNQVQLEFLDEVIHYFVHQCLNKGDRYTEFAGLILRRPDVSTKLVAKVLKVSLEGARQIRCRFSKILHRLYLERRNTFATTLRTTGDPESEERLRLLPFSEFDKLIARLVIVHNLQCYAFLSQEDCGELVCRLGDYLNDSRRNRFTQDPSFRATETVLWFIQMMVSLRYVPTRETVEATVAAWNSHSHYMAQITQAAETADFLRMHQSVLSSVIGISESRKCILNWAEQHDRPELDKLARSVLLK